MSNTRLPKFVLMADAAELHFLCCIFGDYIAILSHNFLSLSILLFVVQFGKLVFSSRSPCSSTIFYSQAHNCRLRLGSYPVVRNPYSQTHTHKTIYLLLIAFCRFMVAAAAAAAVVACTLRTFFFFFYSCVSFKP